MEKQVSEIFYNCLFKEEEIKNGRPCSDFTPVKSINPEMDITVCFCTKRLNDYKEKIIELIEQLNKNICSLNDLYYDINCNKWCDDIKTVDQLIQLAIGCNIISYETIDNNISIKRLKENDKELVKGFNPEELPKVEEPKQIEYTEEEKKLIEENRKLITKEINKYIYTINLGLSFYGIHAEINNDNINQLDFYDKDNNLIYSKKYDDTCGIKVLDFGCRLRTDFDDNHGNKITYFMDDSRYCRHGFLLGSKENEFGCRIELYYDNENKDLKMLEVSMVGKNDDFIIKNFEIGEGNLKVELNNQFGPYGNYIDGEHREIWYMSPENNVNYPSFFMIESIWPNRNTKRHQISGDLNGILLDKNHTTGPLTYRNFDFLTLNITRHPRNKETIEYVINELDKRLPGIKEFIINNFPIYSDVMNGEYKSIPIIDEMINKTIYDKCDIKNKEKNLTR